MPSHSPIVSAAAGDEHSLWLCEDGNVYACGRGTNGQLALDISDTGPGSTGAAAPTLIKAMHQFKVLQMGAGLAHSLLLTEAGEPFAFGSNKSGQLGRRVPGDGLNFELADPSQCFVPLRVAGLGGTRIVQVAAGAEHSVLLSDIGRVLTFGCGRFGRLGLGDESNQPLPRQVDGLRERAIGVFAGGEHTHALTPSGLWSWGNGQCGRLGTGSSSDALTPVCVEGLAGASIAHVSAGLAHTLVALGDGRVCAFGWGAFGQLGLGSTDDVSVPTILPTLRSVRVVAVAAGAQHSLIMDASGCVYACGKGTRGRLGLGEEEGRVCVPTPVGGVALPPARRGDTRKHKVEESPWSLEF
ncbi:MAG: hypothetical protein P4L40_12635 [Terracidiphilus sp.]|nr:hypothetical protein [Terracidiphilus sp.]